MRKARAPLFFSFLVVAASVAFAAFTIPPLTGPVVDSAGIISQVTEERIGEAARHLNDHGGSQIQVLTVPSLEGMSIEQASIQVTDKWQLGKAKTDRGILLFIARDDRKVRIEVGQGNEGLLTDVQSKRIIDESIVPLFRAGDFDSGVMVGFYQIARTVDPEIDLQPFLEGAFRQREYTRNFDRIPINLWFFIILFIFLFLRGLFGGGGRGRGLRRRSGIYYGGLGGWGGGGFGGGGFGGGGGWSGGGGGFSGGGASGSW